MGVSKCCCGCSLHTGCLIIGIMQLVFQAIGAVAIIFIFGLGGGQMVFNCPEPDPTPATFNIQSYLHQSKADPESLEKQNCEMVAAYMNYGMGGFLGYYIVSLGMASLLVAGTVKRNECMLLAWLVWTIICVTLYGLYIVGFGIYVIISGAWLQSVSITASGIGFALWIYFIIVVKSHRKNIMMEKEDSINMETAHDDKIVVTRTTPPTYEEAQESGKVNPGYDLK
eukprot:TRINITY_DN6648_c0_g1_i3.p1 TRINITY_DN6648_c0_g1~~TRINITY_DN6648_c0_g1_i3.p1  ORF type:complete len:226 (-),score=35.47 TRINITY_DN6648_c0_g1_i3:592-1269(-)